MIEYNVGRITEGEDKDMWFIEYYNFGSYTSLEHPSGEVKLWKTEELAEKYLHNLENN